MGTGLNFEEDLQSFVRFSGKPRKNSVSSWLRKLSKQLGVTMEIEMVDIQVRPFLDLTRAENPTTLVKQDIFWTVLRCFI